MKILPCSVSECGRDVKALGYCSTHWKQVRVYKIEPRPIRKWSKQSGNCNLSTCSQPKFKDGWCELHYSQNYRDKNPGQRRRGRIDVGRTCVMSGCEAVTARSFLLCQKHSNVSGTYKLSSVQLQMLYDLGCWICGRKEDLHIDHDHSCCDRNITGKKQTCGKCVRGCLCKSCNFGLGFFGDDVKLLQRAILYLT